VVTLAPEPPDSTDGMALTRAYFDELIERFPPGYDPYEVLPTRQRDLSPPDGVLLIARDGDAAVGCGGLKSFDSATGEIIHMFVQPPTRGTGVGAQILGALEALARARGFVRVVLDTNETLTEAVSLYERSGFVRTDAFNSNPWATHYFEKRLTGK
jgi:GNAT superfamily N-acetyltransferase